jgi:nucleotide-binding universal stress UspA family protein
MAFEKILVPLDGSELAEKALPYAKAIAKLKKSDVVLFAVSITNAGGRRDRLLKSYLDVNAKALESAGIRVSTSVAYGEVAEEIAKYTENNGVNLIIISSHGYSGIKRWMLGSVAQKVLYSTLCPSLLIKSKSSPPSEVEFSKILVPLDCSPFSEITLPYVEELVKGTNSEILLTEVSQPPVVPSYGSRPINPEWEKYRNTLWLELQQQSAEYLDKIKVDLIKRGSKTRTVIAKAEDGKVAQCIIQVAQDEKASLIAITTHGRSGISRWVYGSVTNRLVEESPQPVLLIRPATPS